MFFVSQGGKCMKKWIVSAALLIAGVLVAFLLLSGDEKELVRVDFTLVDAEGNHGDTKMITEEDEVEMLKVVFDAVEWEEAVPDMARREDMNATLFYKIDKNSPEELAEYLIWFNENGKTEVVYEAESSYGVINQEATTALKELMISKGLLDE